MEEKCKCGLKLVFTETSNMIHYGKMECPKHGFIRWIKNPDSTNQRKKINKNKIKNKTENERCCFCCRTKEQLGIKETIEYDHILPLEMNGKDSEENIMPLCTSCHKLKNWTITYQNKHFIKEVK